MANPGLNPGTPHGPQSTTKVILEHSQVSPKLPKKKKTLRIEFSYNSIVPPLRICPKDQKTQCRKDISTPMLTAILLTIDKIWKKPKCPTDDWIRNLLNRYTMDYYTGVLKNMKP